MVGSRLGGPRLRGIGKRGGGCENIKGVGGDRACLWQIPVFWFPGAERGDNVFFYREHAICVMRGGRAGISKNVTDTFR